MQRTMHVSERITDLPIVSKEHPAALGIQRCKLPEPAQLSICQCSIQLSVQRPGVVPWRPALFDT